MERVGAPVLNKEQSSREGGTKLLQSCSFFLGLSLFQKQTLCLTRSTPFPLLLAPPLLIVDNFLLRLVPALEGGRAVVWGRMANRNDPHWHYLFGQVEQRFAGVGVLWSRNSNEASRQPLVHDGKQ